MLAADEGWYLLTRGFYKIIARILYLIRRGRSRKTGIICLLCGAYPEISHKKLSENRNLYPMTNLNILNSKYYSESWTRDRSIFLRKKIQKRVSTGLFGEHPHQPQPFLPHVQLQEEGRVVPLSLKQVSNALKHVTPVGSMPSTTDRKGDRVSSTNPSVTASRESLSPRFSVVVWLFSQLPFSCPPIQNHPPSA